jgi:zinc D-Ala-D-Ala carboxypeptidase
MKSLKTCLWMLMAVSAPAAADPVGSSAGAARVAAVFGTITSTFRSVAHNRAVGGVPNSYHLLGRAIDIVRRRGITHHQIEAALRSAGYSLIESLDEGDHSHFAFAPSVTAIPPKSTASEAPPVPAPPKLRADEHGTLWLDLTGKAQPVR